MKGNYSILGPLEVVSKAERAHRRRGLLTVLAVLVVGCILLLQIGCQQQAGVAGKPQTMVAEKPETAAPQPRRPISPVTAKRTKPIDRRPGPRIKFDNTTCDLGEISPGSKNVCKFEFENTGDRLLTIKKIPKTCGCTAPKLAKREYAPGEKGTVEVEYRAPFNPSPVMRRLYVPSNDKAHPKVALTIKGKVERKVVWEPKELRFSLKGENVSCPEITLTSVDNQPFAIRSFKAPGNCITASFDRSEKATKFVLQPNVDVAKLRSNSSGQIRIDLTHPKCSMIMVRFSVVPEFKVTPRSILANNAEPERPIKRKVSILNNYGEDFEVESVSSGKDIIKVLSKKKVGTGYNFELEITPPVPVGKRGFFTDVFYVNIKGGDKLSINCRGFYSKKRKSS